jgi:hypothetical protein
MPLRSNDIFTPIPTPRPTPRPAAGPPSRVASVPPPLPRHVLSPLVAGSVSTPGPTSEPDGILTLDGLNKAMFVKHDHGLTQSLQREARIAFHEMPFAAQSSLIAEHTKEQLRLVDTYIMLNWKGKGGAAPAPSAREVWLVLWEKQSLPEAQLINSCFPKLRSTASAVQDSAKPERLPAEVLEDKLKELYEFWARRLYSFDRFGSVSQASVLASPARSWSISEMTIISDKAGLPGLGFRIREEADFLASNVGHLVFR